MFTINDLFRWRADLHPDALALVDDRYDQATFSELHHRSLRCAARWSERGVGSGEVVAVLDTNSVAFVVQLLGLSRLGAIPALMNWRLTPAENEAVFDLVHPSAVVSGHALVDRLPPDLPACRVLLDEPTTVEQPSSWEIDDDSDPQCPLPPLALPSDVFALAFSSGTTGQPKGIPWRHESLARSTMVDAAGVAGMTQGARHLLVAPMFHLAGLVNGLMGLARGAEVHLRTSFEPDAFLDDIEALGVSYATAVPAMFRAMVQAANERPTLPDTSSMLEMTYGASPIAPELIRQIRDLFPNTNLRQFYGMTEIAGALTSLTPEDHDHPAHSQTAGRPNPGYEVKLVDSSGGEVPDGEPGQILVRGSSILSGYWNNDEATNEVLVDGWFATGDIATRSEGYLTVMDRAKDMIVSGGENVYPAEVEAELYAHPSIADVAVIGVPDPTYGERVHAVIVTDAGLELDEVQAYCRQRLAGYKVPRSVDVADALPRNATGKILKRELRAPYWENHERKI